MKHKCSQCGIIMENGDAWDLIKRELYCPDCMGKYTEEVYLENGKVYSFGKKNPMFLKEDKYETI